MTIDFGLCDWVAPFGLCVRVAVVSCVSVALSCALRAVLLRYLKPVRGAHWSEFARRAWGLRALLFLALVGFASLGVAQVTLGYEPATMIPVSLSMFIVIVVGGLPLVSVRNGFERRLGALPPHGHPVREMLGFVLIYAPGSLLLLGLVVARLGATPRGFWIGIAISVVYLPLAGLVTVPLARALGALRPARESIVQAVTRAAAAMKLPVPQIYELVWSRANAAALQRLNWIFFTTRAADALTDAELEAIAAHELAHLAEPSRVRRLRLLGSLTWLPVAVGTLYITGGNPLGIVIVSGGTALALILKRHFTRRLEHQADRGAHLTVGDSYATALETIYRLNFAPAVLPGSSHPNLYDRMLATGHVPSFPRPAPPARGLPYLAILLFPVAWHADHAALSLATRVLPPSAAQSDLAFYAAVALEGGQAAELALAQRWQQQGHRSAAIKLLASTLPYAESPARRVALTRLQLEAGDCNGAAETLARLRRPSDRCPIERDLRRICPQQRPPEALQICAPPKPPN